MSVTAMNVALQIGHGDSGAGPLHLIIGGQSICGRTPAAADIYPDAVGLRRWNDGVLDRCSRCEIVLSTRLSRGRPNRSVAA